MLSKEDITNLIEAQKGVFTTKGDLEVFKEEVVIKKDLEAFKDDLKNELKESLSTAFATKQDLEAMKDELRQDFSTLQVSVDGYAKKADTYFQEMAAMKHKMDRHETWLKQIAEKVGMKLEY